MFGALRPTGADAATRALHRAHLCAACHAQREVGGRLSALLTNHDQTLLAVVLAGLAAPGGHAPAVPRPCTALPWRTVAVQPLPPALRAFLAAGNLLLVDAKLRDDLQDGGGLRARLGRWLLRRRVAAAARRLRALGMPLALVASLPERQAAAEREPRPTLAGLAAPSALLLGQVFAHGARLAGRPEAGADLRAAGEAIGSAVYAFDALLDFAADQRRGRFNALAAVAWRAGLPAAVADAAAQVTGAAARATTLLHRWLDADRARLVAVVLAGLGARAAGAADRLLARPTGALARPAEAGDCDLPCDGCSGCDSCDASDGVHCYGPGCDPCCLSTDSQKKAARKNRRSDGDADDDGAAAEATADLQSLVGKRGVVASAVQKLGIVTVDGLDYEAFTTGPLLLAGTPVTVVAVRDGRLRVQKAR